MMNFGLATYGLGLLAGALSTLSPCVLPLVPVLVASAVNAHPWGAMALGIGLALSFAIVGIFLATLGASLGLDPDTFRIVGACILAIFGLVMLVPKLQDLFTRATSILSNSGNQLLARMTFEGLPGQFFVGVSLGLVWSPCVGPTLGAATTLASQGKDLGQIGLLMLIFGVGAAAPLVILGSLSHASMMKVRGRLLSTGKYGKQLLGLIMLGLGILIATGVDKSFEAWILKQTPDWLTAVTTKY
jgi:cytochrome c biogenesis protein CcdA